MAVTTRPALGLTTENLTLDQMQILHEALGFGKNERLTQSTANGDVFASQLEEQGLSLADVWQRLSTNTSIPVMVACAVLRGRVTQCPPDPRLNPLPLPSSPSASIPAKSTHSPTSRPSGPKNAKSGKPTHTDPLAVCTHVAPNPKKPNSMAHTRFNLYRTGASVTELLAAGLTRADIAWDSQRGFVTFALPAPDPAPDLTPEALTPDAT